MREGVGHLIVFGDAVATVHIGASVLHHKIPKVLGGQAVIVVAEQLIIARQPYNFREIGVAVHPVEVVHTVIKVVEQAFALLKQRRDWEVFLLAGGCIHVEQNFIHAAVFLVGEHLFGPVAQPLHAPFGPLGQLICYFKRLFVSTVVVRIQQAGHDLVDHVPGHRSVLMGFQLVEAALRKRGKVSPRHLRVSGVVPIAEHQPLNFGQPIHNCIEFRLIGLIVVSAVQHRQRGHVVALEVACKLVPRFGPPMQGRGALIVQVGAVILIGVVAERIQDGVRRDAVHHGAVDLFLLQKFAVQ